MKISGAFLNQQTFASFIIISILILSGCSSGPKIHNAVESGKYSDVERLVNKGSSINMRDKSGYSPLHLAVIRDRVNIVKLLVQNGADKYAITLDGKTPYTLALINKREEIVNYLQRLEIRISDIDEHSDAIFFATMASNISALKYILSKGGDVNATTDQKLNSLHIAASSGSKEAVLLLLEHGINKYQLSERKLLPVHYAAYTNNFDIVDLLLSKNEVPEIVDGSTRGNHSTANLYNYLASNKFDNFKKEEIISLYETAAKHYISASKGYSRKAETINEEIFKRKSDFWTRYIIVSLLAGAQANITNSPQAYIVSGQETTSIEDLRESYIEMSETTRSAAEDCLKKSDSL